MQQFIDWVVRTIRTVWSWIVNEVTGLFNLPWANLPIWKWYMAVVGALVVLALLIWAIYNMWGAIGKLFRAFGDLLYEFFLVFPWVLAAGLVAYGVLFVVRTF